MVYLRVYKDITRNIKYLLEFYFYIIKFYFIYTFIILLVATIFHKLLCQHLFYINMELEICFVLFFCNKPLYSFVYVPIVNFKRQV